MGCNKEGILGAGKRILTQEENKKRKEQEEQEEEEEKDDDDGPLIGDKEKQSGRCVVLIVERGG